MAHLRECRLRMVATGRHVTGLAINTLTRTAAETTTHWLQRNLGVSHASLAEGLHISSLTEFGYPYADRNERFSGFTLALLDIQLPEGATIMDLPALLTAGLECCPSNFTLTDGPFMQCHIRLLDMHIQVDSPLGPLRAGWPYPMQVVMRSLAPAQCDVVLGVVGAVVARECQISCWKHGSFFVSEPPHPLMYQYAEHHTAHNDGAPRGWDW